MHSLSHHAGRRGASASDLQAFAVRTLDFLHLIEKTVQRLQADTEALRTYAADTRRVVDEFAATNFDHPIDPEGRVCDVLQKSAEAASRIHAGAQRKLEAAEADSALDEEDGVASAYRSFMEAVAQYHDAAEDLRDLVETLDALHSPRSAETFTSADALMKHLLAS